MAGDNLPRNFSWLRVNQIAGCACPNSEMQLRALVSNGIKCLVTLEKTGGCGLPPPCVNSIQGLHWVNIPIKEFSGPSLSDFLEFINICDKARDTGRAVAVHCWMGRGRTGTMLAAYLINYEGKSSREATKEIRLLRTGSVETRDQERSLDMWAEYLEKNPSP